ncbi:hypothetical protein V8D89_005136 [Ganoderma adspersum]
MHSIIARGASYSRHHTIRRSKSGAACGNQGEGTYAKGFKNVPSNANPLRLLAVLEPQLLPNCLDVLRSHRGPQSPRRTVVTQRKNLKVVVDGLAVFDRQEALANARKIGKGGVDVFGDRTVHGQHNAIEQFLNSFRGVRARFLLFMFRDKVPGPAKAALVVENESEGDSRSGLGTKPCGIGPRRARLGVGGGVGHDEQDGRRRETQPQDGGLLNAMATTIASNAGVASQLAVLQRAIINSSPHITALQVLKSCPYTDSSDGTITKAWIPFVQAPPTPRGASISNTLTHTSAMNSSGLRERRHMYKPTAVNTPEPDKQKKLQVQIEVPGPAAARQRLQQQRERILHGTSSSKVLIGMISIARTSEEESVWQISTEIGYWKNDIAKGIVAAVSGVFLLVATTVNFSSIQCYSGCLSSSERFMKGALFAPEFEPEGYRNWTNQPFVSEYLGIQGVKGQFLGFYAVIMQAAFLFFGSEVPGIAAGEVIDATLSGLLVPADDYRLGLGDKGDKTGRSSPSVIAFHRAGWAVLPDVVNAAIMLSACDSEDEDADSGTESDIVEIRREEPPLHDEEMAGEQALPSNQPTYVMPLASVLVSASVGLLTFLSYGALAGSANLNTVFNWLANVASLQSWAGMLFAYIREARAQIEKIKKNRNWDLSRAAPLDTDVVSQFLSAYVPLGTRADIFPWQPFLLLLTFGYKLIKEREMIPLDNMTFYPGQLPRYNPEDNEPKGWLGELRLARLLLI